MAYWGYWKPYVPVWRRRARAARAMDNLSKKGANIQPVVIQGRQIADTFWGQAWCEHLEKFSDFANRLPRGRTYVRNGSVCHLEVRKGKIVAKVIGSEIYDVAVSVKPLPGSRWKRLKKDCAGRVGSMLELLQGRLSTQVMGVVTDPRQGLFPLPKEISLNCSCPDSADMCKHVAAALYGVGARLDRKPDLLFLLRGVDHGELVGEDAAKAVVTRAPAGKGRILDAASLSGVFGIDLAPAKVSRSAKARGKLADASPQRRPRRLSAAGRKAIQTAINRRAEASLARKSPRAAAPRRGKSKLRTTQA